MLISLCACSPILKITAICIIVTFLSVNIKYPLPSRNLKLAKCKTNPFKAERNSISKTIDKAIISRPSFAIKFKQHIFLKAITFDILFSSDPLLEYSEKSFRDLMHNQGVRDSCVIKLRDLHSLPTYYSDTINELLLDSTKQQFVDFRDGLVDYNAWKSEIQDCWVNNPQRYIQQTNNVQH